MARDHQERGYTALAAMMLVAAALLLAGIALQAGQGSRLSASTGNDEALARTIAEAGMERTRAYVGQVLASQIDLDQALDPALNDQCNPPAAATDPTWADDNLPPFADGVVFTGGPGNKKWLRVSQNGGAYLVRIDDDDDDQVNLSSPTIGNHAANGCTEGLAALGLGNQNLARDTNRTVSITVVGMYPDVAVDRALAVKTLRATVGSPPGYGVVAGGNISMSPASDDIDASVVATGNVDVGNITGNARSGGTCSGSASCVSGASIPPLPKVDPWDIANAPTAAVGGVGTNFYYALYDGTAPRLYRWNYGASGCADPRAWSRICYPYPGGVDADQVVNAAGTLCASCWAPVLKEPGDLPQPAGQIVVGNPSQPVWDVSPHSGPPWTGCTGTDPDAYPAASLGPWWDAARAPNAKFTWHAGTPFGAATSVPGSAAGIWLVAGDVDFTSSTACTDTASIIALGDITLHTGHTNVNLIPAAPKPYVLLAGRDMQLHGGNGGINSGGCTPVVAAVMVHEQLEFQSGNDTINAQVVAENAVQCSTTVSGPDAIKGHGNDAVNVPFPPPIGVGPSAVLLDFQESGF